MANKRVIDLPDLSQEVQEGQYVLVDSVGGTGKMDLKHIVDEAGSFDPAGEYPELYAGNLTTDKAQTDKTPYLFRKTGGNLSRVGERCYDTVIGASVGSNQLVKNGNFADTSTWDAGTGTSFSVSGNVATVTQSSADGYIKQSLPLIANHKYFKELGCKFDSGIKCSTNGIFPTVTGNGNWQTVSKIANASNSSTEYIVIKATNDTFPEGGTTFYLRNIMYIDLTQMLGSSIADYIYQLESATAGSGISKLREWGFLRGYQAFNAGSLESVEVTGKVVRGFNQWDEEWVNAYHNSSGVQIADVRFISCKNKIRVLPSTTYYFKSPNIDFELFEYGSDGDFIRQSSSYLKNATFTTGTNTGYIEFSSRVANALTTYNNDICINLSSDRNGEYEAYVSQSYDYGDDTLNGIFKLDANNNLYADGDVKTSDGTITRKYGIVDLGTLDWIDNTENGTRTENTFSVGKYHGYIVCPKYVCSTTAEYATIANGEIAITNSQTYPLLRIKDSAFENKTGAEIKALLNGVYMIYEKTTPTTETGDPFPSPQICYPDGTEEYVTGNGVPVGHETEYPYDLKGLVEGLIDVPDVPSTNGTYVLKATRSASGIVYNWVTG